jgi:hypothetical protein
MVNTVYNWSFSKTVEDTIFNYFFEWKCAKWTAKEMPKIIMEEEIQSKL